MSSPEPPSTPILEKNANRMLKTPESKFLRWTSPVAPVLKRPHYESELEDVEVNWKRSRQRILSAIRILE